MESLWIVFLYQISTHVNNVILPGGCQTLWLASLSLGHVFTASTDEAGHACPAAGWGGPGAPPGGRSTSGLGCCPWKPGGEGAGRGARSQCEDPTGGCSSPDQLHTAQAHIGVGLVRVCVKFNLPCAYTYDLSITRRLHQKPYRMLYYLLSW